MTKIYRTKHNRQMEIRPIIEKLNELQLTTFYDEIKQLYKLMQEYIKTGNRIIIKIPFPAIKKNIVGILASNVKEPVVLKLQSYTTRSNHR